MSRRHVGQDEMLNRGSATIFELLFVLTRNPKPAEVTEACRPEIRYVMVESPAYFHAIRPASRYDELSAGMYH